MENSQDQDDAIEHLEQCTKQDCSLCNHLLEFYMTCDVCGAWGHQDSHGWSSTDGVPICSMCADSGTPEDSEDPNCQIADGEYRGVWSGHFLRFASESRECVFETDLGIRGINVPVFFHVVDGHVDEQTIEVIEKGGAT